MSLGDLAGAVAERAAVRLAVAGDPFVALAARTGLPVLHADAHVEEFADAAALLVREHRGGPAAGGVGDLVKPGGKLYPRVDVRPERPSQSRQS